jgi:hypothetical protein
MDLVFAPSQIETWPIDRLRPYARNAKIHGTDQVAKIMAKFGWTVPCMVTDDGELIAGHGRVLAAAMLGLKDVPVIRLSHLDEAERRAYRIADNKLTELGDWDEAMLRDEIGGCWPRISTCHCSGSPTRIWTPCCAIPVSWKAVPSRARMTFQMRRSCRSQLRATSGISGRTG